MYLVEDFSRSLGYQKPCMHNVIVRIYMQNIPENIYLMPVWCLNNLLMTINSCKKKRVRKQILIELLLWWKISLLSTTFNEVSSELIWIFSCRFVRNLEIFFRFEVGGLCFQNFLRHRKMLHRILIRLLS